MNCDVPISWLFTRQSTNWSSLFGKLRG